MKLFMFVAFVAVLTIGVNTAFAQVPAIQVPIAVTVEATALEIDPGGGLAVSGLTPGKTYTIIPDGLGGGIVTPPDASSLDTFDPITITGDLGAQVLVSFVLPSRLYGDGIGGYVDVSYNSTSAAWGGDGTEGNYFDPHVPTVVTLDGTGGTAFVQLGAILKIGATATAGDYLGEALVTAQYTGL